MKFFANRQFVISVVITVLINSYQSRAIGKTQGDNQASADIFSTIWNLPDAHVQVTVLGHDGKPVDPAAVVVVDEQGAAGHCLNQDNAPRPLIRVLDESIFEEETFATLIPLFDNYTAIEQRPEIQPADAKHPHWQEVDDFLDAVFKSEAMKTAVSYIQTELSPNISQEKIRADVRKMWFEPYSNRYRDTTNFCVGFEHVFIGEDESHPEHNNPCTDTVAGYHSWVKFYHEQKMNKADSLGYDYPDANVADALAEPRVTTIVMRWSPTAAADRSHGNDLLKKPGGFFVGTKPEVEIAFGTLAMYMQLANKYDNVPDKNNHHRVRLGKNYFDIVMHPQSLAPTQNGQNTRRGMHIRTLYPKFRGQRLPNKNLPNEGMPKTDLPTQPHNDAAIQIVSALPNPKGPEDQGEWIKLKNVTEDTDFDLAQWSLADKTGRTMKLAGCLKAGQTITIKLNRLDKQSMMLSNRSGWIILHQGQIRRAAVKYDNARTNQTIEFAE